MPDYTDIWDQYDLAVGALYDVLGLAETATFPAVRSIDVHSRVDLVITTSGRLADAMARDLTAPVAGDRERAMLRLMAGAAADLAIANDLIQAQGEEPGLTTREIALPIYPQLMSDLGPVLGPDSATSPGIATRGDSFRPRPDDLEEALAQLRWTATRSFDAIADDVIDVGQMAIGGLIALEAVPVKQAAAVAVQELLNKVGDGLDALLQQAVRLLIQAYDKLLKALGRDAAADARQQAARWIRMLGSGTPMEKLVNRLYEKQRILEDIEAHAKQARQALMSDAFSTVLSETRNLAERFQHHRRCIIWVLRGLAFAKDWLFTIEPWGPLAVTAVYLGTFAYSVYAGGDYVDWFRTERIQPLDRVPGLRDIVRETLITQSNPEG